jgi:drug/metabolite transporter (DMT)-like permease
MVVTGLDFAVLKANLAGAGLVLVCSLTFAIYYLLSDRYTPRIGSVAFTVYALSAATACLVVHCVVLGRLRPLPLDGAIAGLMAGLVLVATVFGMLAMSEGVRRLGAQRAAVVSTVGPPTTILLGAALLGERLTGPQWVGVALIVAGIVVLEAGRQKAPAPAPD